MPPAMAEVAIESVSKSFGAMQAPHGVEVAAASSRGRAAAGTQGGTVMDSPGSGEGGCRCGRLRFRVSAPPIMTAACHCRGCQRMTGGAFSLTAIVPADAFAVIAGDPVRGGLRAELEHFFCGDCLSWVFTEVTDDLVNVRSPLFDQPPAAPPYMETMTAEKKASERARLESRFQGAVETMKALAEGRAPAD